MVGRRVACSRSSPSAARVHKLALIALGYTGALQWFAPVQPFLGVAAVGLLLWALRARLQGHLACLTPDSPKLGAEVVAPATR